METSVEATPELTGEDNVKHSAVGESNTDNIQEIVKPSDKAEVLEAENNVPPNNNGIGVAKEKELTWENIAAEISEDQNEELEENTETEKSDKKTETEKTNENTETEKSDAKVVASDQGETLRNDVADVTKEKKSADDQTSVEKIIEDFSDEESENAEALRTATIKTSAEDILEESHVAVNESEAEEPLDSSTEQVTITVEELKSDVAIEEIPEEEIHYEVVEEEAETHETIEEHLAQDGTVVYINNADNSQTEITIEQIDDQENIEHVYMMEDEAVDDPVESVAKPPTKQEVVKPKKPRGRKPIADIPLHVLGRDITKPTEGVSNGGRIMPKPRLGVKVPYRNLTSQIVTKQEIEQEIMDRFKSKQEQNAAAQADMMFARSLTQRLAKKLLPSEKERSSQKSPQPSTSEKDIMDSEIKNNSDLLAILEGHDDDVPPPTKVAEAPKPADTLTDREIALQQLKELPLSPNKINKDEKKSQPEPAPKTPVKIPKPVEVKTAEKKQIEAEPSLKTETVVKTYTRKRKSFDSDPLELPPKKTVVQPPIEGGSNVYVTKSSRVIKKKVIWDPDEVTAKSPIRSPKVESPVKQAASSKAAEKKQDPLEKKVQVSAKEKKSEATLKSVEKKSAVKETPKEKKAEEKTFEKKTPIPIKKGPKSPIKKPKRLTEIDRLLMDEGAVNMLYDVQNTEEGSPKKKTKDVISLDKAHKELMSRTNSIKNDLQQNTNKDAQKVLRKKEGVPTSSPPKKDATPNAQGRKRSKDSSRSSVHSPPASPFNVAEASRIIRRHSSSSYSSNDDVEEVSEETEARPVRKKSLSTSEVPRKKLKKNSEKSAQNNNNPEKKVVGKYKTLGVVKRNRLVSIKLNKVENSAHLTEAVLKELTSCLNDLGNDDDCNVVSITSDNKSVFSLGLDYTVLINDDETARKKRATELSTLVKDFLRCLLNFPKVLVAGIQGDCAGLAVTMLPLFDIIIANDNSTFSTPYAKIGCAPEGGFLLAYLNNRGLASELLYTSETVNADEAFRKGLVTKLCWPEKYDEQLKATLSSIADKHRESIESTKKQLRSSILQNAESNLNSNAKVLVEHWTGEECQKNFVSFKQEIDLE